MTQFTIKLSAPPKLEIPGFTSSDMQAIGQDAIDIMKERVAQAEDVFDRPARPLTPRYAARKVKKGKEPIRDINLTGNTLGSIQEFEVDANHVKISIRGNTPYRKALFNQYLDPWFGLSDHDAARVLNESVEPLFAMTLHDAFK